MSIGQYVDTFWPVNRWTGQYPILAYIAWRDLNQSQPHISIRGVTIFNINQDVAAAAYEADMNGELDTDAGCNDKNDGRYSTQLYAEQTHQAEYLQNYHAKHHHLQIYNINTVCTDVKFNY